MTASFEIAHHDCTAFWAALKTAGLSGFRSTLSIDIQGRAFVAVARRWPWSSGRMAKSLL